MHRGMHPPPAPDRAIGAPGYNFVPIWENLSRPQTTEPAFASGSVIAQTWLYGTRCSDAAVAFEGRLVASEKAEGPIPEPSSRTQALGGYTSP
jgi:hypothetical protein